MSDLNMVTLTGRLVRDPDVRRGDSGNLWGVFTLASNYHYKDKGGAFQEEAAFVDCKTFGRWAESLAKRKKGDMALVAGRLRSVKIRLMALPAIRVVEIVVSADMARDARL